MHSSSLKFNAVAEWWDEYIAYVFLATTSVSTAAVANHLDLFSSPRYSALKKHIYALEKQYARLDGRIDDLEAATNERSTLLGGVRALTGVGGAHPADDTFSSLLDRELEKIVRFYREQETELLRELHQLEADIAQRDADGPVVTAPYDYFDEDEEDEEGLSPSAGQIFFVYLAARWWVFITDTCSSNEARYESLAPPRLD